MRGRSRRTDPVDAAQRDESPGRPLEPHEARDLGAWFGVSLGGVRVHEDGAAASLASDLDAAAFTRGGDVYFGAGHGVHERGLLAHEIAHVLQPDARDAPDAPAEHEAEAAAARVTTGRPAGALVAPAPPLARAPEAAAGSRIFELEGELDGHIRAIENALDSLVYTEAVEEGVIRIIVRWSNETARPAGAPTGYWLDRLFGALSAAKTTSFFRETTYYDQIFDHFDRVDEVRKLRDGAPMFSGRESASQTAERREEAEKRESEERKALAADEPEAYRENVAVPTSLPETPENLHKAKVVADALMDIPDERQSLELRSLSIQIRRAREAGDPRPERVLLEGVHFVTHEERERWKKALARRIVLTVLEFAAFYVGGEVLAMVAPDLVAALAGAELEAGAAPAYESELAAESLRPTQAADTEATVTARTLGGTEPNMAPVSDIAPKPTPSGTTGGGPAVVARSTQAPAAGGQVGAQQEIVAAPAAPEPTAAPTAVRPAPAGAHAEVREMSELEGGQEVTREELQAEAAQGRGPTVVTRGAEKGTPLWAPGAATGGAVIAPGAPGGGPKVDPRTQEDIKEPGETPEKIGDPDVPLDVLEAHPLMKQRPGVARMTREISITYRGIPIYLDPLTNTWKVRWGQVQADHFIPVRYILDQIVGGNAPLLTDAQITALLTYEGNFQALPAPLNYSKAGILPSQWTTYKGRPVSADYRKESAVYEAKIIAELKKIMQEFLRQNAQPPKKKTSP